MFVVLVISVVVVVVVVDIVFDIVVVVVVVVVVLLSEALAMRESKTARIEGFAWGKVRQSSEARCKSHTASSHIGMPDQTEAE